MLIYNHNSCYPDSIVRFEYYSSMLMRLRFFLLYFICISAHCNFSLSGQDNVRIREDRKEYVTYPYSDANPFATFGKIYPYYRYDGFASQSEIKAWKIVELENEWLKMQILPEIGGKIWSVIDKLSGKEMFYGNNVVKFWDISLRGPWTSGGIEFNYGIVGHSPNSSFPVDYLLENKSDGSVSCYINTLDLLTRTYWTVEINLPADKGWFTTRSFWHNKTGLSQPYSNWVNTGMKAKSDLRFIYPGTDVIQHNGERFPWPADTVNGKDFTQWRELDFGSSKSFHITGQHAPYFGAYWEDEKWGIMQYAERDNKLGRKIFSWALSDQGGIWEELLTDYDGQYVELQSGRLFNQNMVTSSPTPFKQTGFAPHGTDVWTEYWFPYRDTDGAANCMYAMSVLMLDRVYDALDGFQVAAYTELGKLYFKRGDYASACGYAGKSLINNQLNVEGLQLLYLSNKYLRNDGNAIEVSYT